MTSALPPVNYLLPLLLLFAACDARHAWSEPFPAKRAMETGLFGPRRLAFNVLHRFERGDCVHPRTVVFMSGIPGSGKTTIIERRYHPDRRRSETVVLDIDAQLATHPRYDPSDPDKLFFEGGTKTYEWADAKIEERFHAALSERSARRIVIDGTGTNTERQERRMRAARDAGWFVKVLYVHIPVETAVRRAAARERPVSAQRVRMYQQRVGSALEHMAHLADELEVYDAPSHDPAHVLMGEGFADSSRTLVMQQADAEMRVQMRRIEEIRRGRHEEGREEVPGLVSREPS